MAGYNANRGHGGPVAGTKAPVKAFNGGGARTTGVAAAGGGGGGAKKMKGKLAADLTFTSAEGGTYTVAAGSYLFLKAVDPKKKDGTAKNNPPLFELRAPIGEMDEAGKERWETIVAIYESTPRQ